MGSADITFFADEGPQRILGTFEFSPLTPTQPRFVVMKGTEEDDVVLWFWRELLSCRVNVVACDINIDRAIINVIEWTSLLGEVDKALWCIRLLDLYQTRWTIKQSGLINYDMDTIKVGKWYNMEPSKTKSIAEGVYIVWDSTALRLFTLDLP